MVEKGLKIDLDELKEELANRTRAFEARDLNELQHFLEVVGAGETELANHMYREMNAGVKAVVDWMISLSK